MLFTICIYIWIINDDDDGVEYKKMPTRVDSKANPPVNSRNLIICLEFSPLALSQTFDPNSGRLFYFLEKLKNYMLFTFLPMVKNEDINLLITQNVSRYSQGLYCMSSKLVKVQMSKMHRSDLQLDMFKEA